MMHQNDRLQFRPGRLRVPDARRGTSKQLSCPASDLPASAGDARVVLELREYAGLQGREGTAARLKCVSSDWAGPPLPRLRLKRFVPKQTPARAV